jgi:hypothetical protein
MEDNSLSRHGDPQRLSELLPAVLDELDRPLSAQTDGEVVEALGDPGLRPEAAKVLNDRYPGVLSGMEHLLNEPPQER